MLKGQYLQRAMFFRIYFATPLLRRHNLLLYHVCHDLNVAAFRNVLRACEIALRQCRSSVPVHLITTFLLSHMFLGFIKVKSLVCV